MKLAALVLATFAASATAEDYAPAPYIPDPLPCTAPVFYGTLGWSIETAYIDESCMDRQKTRSAVEYCAKKPEECGRTVMMVGDVPLVLEYPKPESDFHRYTR